MVLGEKPLKLYLVTCSHHRGTPQSQEYYFFFLSIYICLFKGYRAIQANLRTCAFLFSPKMSNTVNVNCIFLRCYSCYIPSNYTITYNMYKTNKILFQSLIFHSPGWHSTHLMLPLTCVSGTHFLQPTSTSPRIHRKPWARRVRPSIQKNPAILKCQLPKRRDNPRNKCSLFLICYSEHRIYQLHWVEVVSSWSAVW